MVMIYRERIDLLYLEIYDLKPFLRFRHIPTGRFVRRPDYISYVYVCGGTTWGGKEPIEVEAIFQLEVETSRLVEIAESGEWLVDFIKAEGELETRMDFRCERAVEDNFNPWIAETLEKRKRELRVGKIETKIILRYRKFRRGRWEKWRRKEIEESPEEYIRP